MMRMKRALLAAGAVLASAAMSVSSYAQFSKTHNYADGMFSDVDAGAWYAPEVKGAYELGFMNGTGDGKFSPSGNVTVAQAVAVAARLYAVNNGETIPASDAKDWYAPYTEYAISKGIISENSFDGYTGNAKRSEAAEIMYNALPEDFFLPVNDVKKIPDVSASSPVYQKLLSLYRAGVVMGSDEYGTFYPDNTITRAEYAAVINRAALPESRLKKTLKENVSDDAYLLCRNMTYTSGKEGIASGWVFDNRGGPARTSIDGSYGELKDISTEYGTAMIREFNRTDTGTIVLETVYVLDSNGTYLEFRDEDGNSTYRIQTDGNAWKILGKDGKYTAISENAIDGISAKKFRFRIYICLDEGVSRTYINDEYLGEYPLLSDNVLNYRYATDEKCVGTVTAGSVVMPVNYKVYEDFTHFGASEVYGWTVSEGVNSSNELVLANNSSARKSFDGANGKVAAETYFILPDGGEFSYSLLSSGKTAVVFDSKDGKFRANGKEVYTFTKNMWYRLRIAADTDNGTADIYLNGRVIANVPLSASGSIDAFEVKTANNTAKFDNMNVFELVEHDDYVPEPTARANYDDYAVGVNVCSLWRNGDHYGWACITPYDEPRPVLGYYDEGNPEVSDWEIKFMTEHGIDFQAFCWFSDTYNAPVKEPSMSAALHNGYMYAKYSDYMDYAIIWEASNGNNFNADTFRTKIVPYWFENYFLDDRYVKLDNKILLFVFGAGKLGTSKYFGSAQNARAQLDFLDETAKSYGFDGVVVISDKDNADTAMLAACGVDADYAYHWNTSGKTVEANQKGMLDGAENKNVYSIPTVSVGFDCMPWYGIRNGNMTVSDYRTINKWVVDDYFKKYPAEKGAWNDRLVMLSTWNEFGEGTYIAPCGLNGFGYLDVVRGTYTNLEKTHDDAVPTEAQAKRINRLYPQYARLLRNDGWFWYENAGVKETDIESIFKYDFTPDNSAFAGIDSSTLSSENGVSARSASDSNDPVVYTKNVVNADIADAAFIKVTAKVPKGLKLEIFYTVNGDTDWNQKKSFNIISDSDELKTYMIRIRDDNFSGKLRRIRIDPGNKPSIDFTVKSFEVLKFKSGVNSKLFVNDTDVSSEIPNDINSGNYLYAFDPAKGQIFALNSFCTWRKENGTLKIEANGHTVGYTVGSDKYKADGKEKDLGYRLYTKDGLPMLSFKTLCAELGYGYTEKDGNAYVKTPQYTPAEETAKPVPGVWNFDGYDSENWSSDYMALFTKNGTMTMTVLDDTNYDPSMYYKGALALNSSKYKEFEIKVRYKYYTPKEGNQKISVYFTTNADASWNEAKSIKVELKSRDSGQDWETYTVDLTQLETWKNTINGLRFDPFNASGYMEVDYMKFITAAGVDESELMETEFSIINGDAEDTSNVAFYSVNGKVTIIPEPGNESNHVYLVTGNPGKNWTYFRQSVTYKLGKKYTVSFDVKLVGDTAGNGTSEGSFACNLRYFDESATNNFEHTIKTFKANTSEWVHVESVHIPKQIDGPDGHDFSIYADPVGDISLSYMVDNVVVTEEDA